jgi:hypothetical protein
MLRWAGMAAAVMLVAWPARFASADEPHNCYETAQINIDCTAKSDGAAAPKPAPSTSQLRDTLRQALERGAAAKPPPVSAEALAKSIHDAQARAQRALDAAASASDPAQQDKALKAYNGAIRDLDAAYDKAAGEADTEAGRDRLLQMKAADEQAFATKANDAFAAQLDAAQAAQTKGPDNVGMTDGYVFVCDGPLQSDHVSCREIPPDGKSCVAVIAFDGKVNWRDSAATPCSAQDLAQRAAYLGSHDGAQDQAQAAAMNGPGCQGIINDYIVAAEAGDGGRAASAYGDLRRAGGCGVLDKAEQQLKTQGAGAGGDSRFVTRGATTNIDNTFGACDKLPEQCDQLASQLKAGTSSAAIAALYSNAIGIGLQIGGMMGNAVLNAQALNLAHGAAAVQGGGAAGGAARGGAQYPRAISCTVRGCITTSGLGPSGNQSTITGLIR